MEIRFPHFTPSGECYYQHLLEVYVERQISYITYMWNLKKNDTNEVIYKTEIDHRHRKQTYGYQRGEGGGIN